jgi:hypothetical protein
MPLTEIRMNGRIGAGDLSIVVLEPFSCEGFPLSAHKFWVAEREVDCAFADVGIRHQLQIGAVWRARFNVSLVSGWQ